MNSNTKKPQSTQSTRPPKFAKWLLKTFLNDAHKQDILGDFEENYIQKVDSNGKLSAYFWYWAHALNSFPAFMFNSISWSTIMLNNYYITFLRSFKRNKMNTFTNIVSLSLGITACMLIYLFVTVELSYDKFHANLANIMIITQGTDREISPLEQGIGKDIGQRLLQDIPTIDALARYTKEDINIKVGADGLSNYERVTFADPELFEIFSFGLAAGSIFDKNGMNSILISREMSRKYFSGDLINGRNSIQTADQIGKELLLEIDNKFVPFQVVGIFDGIPSVSSIQLDFVVIFENMRAVLANSTYPNWEQLNSYLFIKLIDGQDFNNFKSSLPNLVTDYGAEPNSWMGSPAVGMGKVTGELIPVPFKDFHFDSSIGSGFDLEERSSPIYSIILTAIGFLILITACINFMNLSIGQSVKRIKEIGVRKVLGAFRLDLIKQFYFESFLLSSLSMIFGILGVFLLTDYFGGLFGKSINFSEIPISSTLLLIPLFMLFVTFLAGTYPALYVSKFNPAKIIGGIVKKSNSNYFMKGLVILQFSISVFLIISSIIMSSQLSFMLNKDIGFNPYNVVVIDSSTKDTNANSLLLKEELSKLSGVERVGLASGGGFYTNNIGFATRFIDEKTFTYRSLKIDYDFFETMDITLKEGRNFDRNIESDDSASVIVNEAYIRAYAETEKLGEVTLWGRKRNIKIIGIAKDFNYKSLHNEIQPLVMHMKSNTSFSRIYVKLNASDTDKFLNEARSIWTKIVPEETINYRFVDERYASLYNADQNWRGIISLSMYIAIFIACLGLYSISSITANYRRQEFGIRKVLGARISGLIFSFNKEYLLMILAANVIAWPLSYYAMQDWLQKFAYRMQLGSSVFFYSVIISALITVITVSIHAYKVCSANPAHTLKNE